jgi:hypothetical protein
VRNTHHRTYADPNPADSTAVRGGLVNSLLGLTRASPLPPIRPVSAQDISRGDTADFLGEPSLMSNK